MRQFSSSPPAVIQDRYVLEAWLGRDAAGTAYQARDRLLARSVVVKFLERVPSNACRRMIGVAHPHIVSLYEIGEQAGWHYLVQEHIHGMVGGRRVIPLWP